MNIEACEFDHNGVETGGAAGFEHNIYIGHSRSARVAFCYFHRSIVGHELKCRANRSYILYNHIVDEDGDGSLSIDLPNGGLAFIIGNSVEKGPNTANSTIFGYGEEGIINPDSEYYFINNTVVSDRVPTTFINLQKGAVATLKNNIIVGNIHPLAGWTDTAGNIFTSDRSQFNFKDAGHFNYIPQDFNGGQPVDPGITHGFSLAPSMMYVDPLDSATISFGNDRYAGAFPVQFGGRSVATDRNANPLNYPNPFIAETHIRCELPDGIAQLLVLNASGALIEQRPIMIQDESFTFDRGMLHFGLYHYQIISPHGRARGSFVIE